MPLAPNIGSLIAEAPRARVITDRRQDLDAKTYAAAKADLVSGRPVVRHSATGAVVPAHLQGTLYSVRDLHASAFAELDAQMERFAARHSPALKLAAE